MMRASHPIFRLAAMLAATTAAGLLSFFAVQHGRAARWANSENPDLWLRAAELEPSNPDNWYRLGRYRQLDFEHADLELATTYYQQAVALNPHAARYWMDLSSAYEMSRNVGEAERDLETAQRVYPNSGEVAWRFGNFLLRQNRVDEAFAQIRHAVAEDPRLTALAVSRCWRSTGDINRILTSVLPATPGAYRGALDFLIDAGEPDGAMDVWKRLVAARPSFELQSSFPLFEMLLAKFHYDDALTVWQQSLSLDGVKQPPTATGSLIWNGGFEGDLLNGGFSWRYRPQVGADINWDEQTYHSGSRSLRLDFDGTANVDFQEFWQYVLVQPNTRYRFGAYVRTEELTTERGIHFQIDDVTRDGDRAAIKRTAQRLTADVGGTKPWSLEQVEFTTAADSRLLRVILRRLPSDMLVNKARGTAWVDDVTLVAQPTPARESR